MALTRLFTLRVRSRTLRFNFPACRSIFFMVRDIGTTNYHEVFTRAHDVWPKGSSDANWVALLLLLGAVAKSAQILSFSRSRAE